MAVRNPRGGLPPGPGPVDRTDFTFADRYIEDRKLPKYERIKAKFPLVEDRKAISRIPFESDELRRSYRGKVPLVPIDYNNLSINPPDNLAQSKYLFHSDAPNASNVPEGYYGTSSGIYPIDFIPFSVGEPTEKGVTINLDYVPTQSISGEFYFILYDNRQVIKETQYYPNDSNSLGVMMEWKINPNFSNPTEPELRYPRGAFKKPYFK